MKYNANNEFASSLGGSVNEHLCGVCRFPGRFIAIVGFSRDVFVAPSLGIPEQGLRTVSAGGQTESMMKRMKVTLEDSPLHFQRGEREPIHR